MKSRIWVYTNDLDESLDFYERQHNDAPQTEFVEAEKVRDLCKLWLEYDVQPDPDSVNELWGKIHLAIHALFPNGVEEEKL